MDQQEILNVHNFSTVKDCASTTQLEDRTRNLRGILVAVSLISWVALIQEMERIP